MTNNKEVKHRRLEGIVVSDKMQKTVVVAVTRTATHPKYLKQYKITTKFKAHDEKNEYKTGDRVMIEETRPISKDKKWKVAGSVQKSNIKNQDDLESKS